MTWEREGIALGALALVGLVFGFTLLGQGTPSLAGASVGLFFATGVLVIVSAFRPDTMPDAIRELDKASSATEFHQLRATIAVGVGILALVVIGWLGAAIGAAAAVYFLPEFFKSAGGYKQHAAVTEGIAAWIEQLRDKMAASHGLEGALVTTAKTAPTAIRQELLELVLEVDHGVSTRDALINLSERLAHPICDIAVATMVMSLDRDATRINEVLNELATSSRESAASMLAIHAQRSASRTTVKMVVGITVFLIAILLLAFRDFLSFYDSPIGQLVLLGGFAGIGGALAWVARLSAPAVPFRAIRPGALR